MLSITHALLAAIANAVLFLVVIPLLGDLKKWWYLPHGPTPLPFLGNKLVLAKKIPWLKFEEWAKVYGDVYTIWIGRRPTLVVSCPSLASDLLESPERSKICSNRPRSVVFGEIFNKMQSIVVKPYGPEWIQQRALLYSVLKTSALTEYLPRKEAEASRLAFQFCNQPQEWKKATERYTASVAFCTAYGRRIDSLSSNIVAQKLGFVKYIGQLLAVGLNWTEAWPWLKLMPNFLTPWKREVEEMGRQEREFNMRLFEEATKKSEASPQDSTFPNLESQCNAEVESRPTSLAKSIVELKLKNNTPGSLSMHTLAQLLATLFAAGFDTTNSTLSSFILAMINYPDILTTAQKEIDFVCGIDRSPTFADRDSGKLPYIEALLKETLRWKPSTPLGVQHQFIQDVGWRGYKIPAGTAVVVSNWATMRNERFYPNGETFDPTRFLGEKARFTSKGSASDRGLHLQHPHHSGHNAFGWGRRACPGEGMALNTLWIAIAKLVWGFNFVGLEAGEKIDENAYEGGSLMRPKDFRCKLVVRGEKYREVLEKEVKGAEEVLKRFPAYE